jgi:hypothetical protein
VCRGLSVARSAIIGSPKRSIAAKAISPKVIARSRPDVGHRLGAAARRVREQQGITLADVAADAAFWDSNRARGRTPRAARNTSARIRRKGDCTLRGLGSWAWSRSPRHSARSYPLATCGAEGAGEAVRAVSGDADWQKRSVSGFQQPGSEFIYVLAGSLIYRYRTHSYPLAPGDSLCFRGDVRHGPEEIHQAPHIVHHHL